MSRHYLNAARLDRLADDLSDRELAILRSLDRIRLASGAQLERLHFSGSSARQRRRILESLTDRRLLCRLDRFVGGRRAGSSGYLYALDVAGQRLLARRTGMPVRRPTTPGAPFIAHVLDVTELYVGLVEAERRGVIELLDFQAEPAAWRRYPGPGGGTAIVKPDAYVRIGSGGYEDSYFIEVDRGSEAPSTLARKADTYRAYYASGLEQHRHNLFPRVLWTVPNERRHQTLVDVCSRQPADSWQLHQVTLFAGAVGLMAGGAA